MMSLALVLGVVLIVLGPGLSLEAQIHLLD